jgi:hypothetical protein
LQQQNFSTPFDIFTILIQRTIKHLKISRLCSARMSENHNFKVVLLGEGCVGKTSLVVRYVQNEFFTEHRTTIQASFMSKRINVENARVNIAIWVCGFCVLGLLDYFALFCFILCYILCLFLCICCIL